MLRATATTGRRRLGSCGNPVLLRFSLSHYDDREQDVPRRLPVRNKRRLGQRAGQAACSQHHLPPSQPLMRHAFAYHVCAASSSSSSSAGTPWTVRNAMLDRASFIHLLQKQVSSSSSLGSELKPLPRSISAGGRRSSRSSSSSSNSTGSTGSNKYQKETPSPLPQTSRQVKEKSEHVVKLALGGNVVITIAKFLAWLHSGSSAMLSESIHSLVDCGNQTLLLIGIRTAATAPDRHHQYGYGKSIYFWSLVSALGTFWLGAGVSLRNSFSDLLNPTVQLEEITWDVWGVLGISFAIDGSVLYQTFQLLKDSKPKHLTLWEHVRRIRDPTTLAVLLEDSGACLGVVMAMVGIGLSQAFANPMFDSIAGCCISGLLAAMGLALARLNERYLLGQAVEPEIVEGIRKLLMARPGIDNVQSVQSQWIGPYTFAYKAEVDFDGTYLAAKLMERYEDEFLGSARLKEDLPVLLAFYAEDVVRTLEREVREVEREIRALHPEAQFIELEPASKDATAFAIDGHREKMLRELEHVTLNQLLIAIAKNVVKQQQEKDGGAETKKDKSKKEDERPILVSRALHQVGGQGRTMSDRFYDSDSFNDPSCPPPVPTSTPVTNPFAQPKQSLFSPLDTASLSGKIFSMANYPSSSPPTPVGNPFEEPDVFAASSKPLAAPVTATSLPFQVLHQASAPVGMAVAPMPPVIATSPTFQQARGAMYNQPTPVNKPVYDDVSDFDPYSPSAARKKAAGTTPTCQLAPRPDVALNLFKMSPLPAAKSRQHQEQQEQQEQQEEQEQEPERQLDDSWNIEWSPEAILTSSSEGSEIVSPTSGASGNPSSSQGKTCAEARSRAAFTTTSPFALQLPEGVLLARVSTRSFIVREWKSVYWVVVNKRLWIYRSKSDYNPTDYVKDPFSERIKKCIRLHDRLLVTRLKSKLYPGEKHTLFTFNLENVDEQGGKSLVAKFAGYMYDDVRALREEVDKRVFDARHGPK